MNTPRLCDSHPAKFRGSQINNRVHSVVVLFLIISAMICSGCKTKPTKTVKESPETFFNKPKTKSDKKPNKGCTIAGVQRVVRPHIAKIKRCYRQGISRDPNLSGRLVVEINIDRSGAAKFLGVKQDTLKDVEVTKCIFSVLKPLAYPYPMQDACVVLYPFNFTAGASATKS